MAYDPKCYDLAETFLSDLPGAAHLASRLAQHIQDEIEGWLEYERKKLAGELGVIFNRPECIFNYCPHPEHCQESCKIIGGRPMPNDPLDQAALEAAGNAVYAVIVEHPVSAKQFSGLHPLVRTAVLAEADAAIRAYDAARPQAGVPDGWKLFLEQLLPHLDNYQTYLDDSDCGDVCDKTHEFQGCQGVCALESGKQSLRKLMAQAEAMRAAAPQPPAGVTPASPSLLKENK